MEVDRAIAALLTRHPEVIGRALLASLSVYDLYRGPRSLGWVGVPPPRRFETFKHHRAATFARIQSSVPMSEPLSARGPVKIRGFCFTLVCDDGPERRGFRTGGGFPFERR
jgi:hypothetical protein